METFWNAYKAYASYLWSDISHPHWKSFFWWTLGLSIFFFALEAIKPWREKQPLFRKDFWIDLFYIFFNFFLFSQLFWYAGQQVLLHGLNSVFAWLGYENGIAKAVFALPVWAYFLVLFLVSDFISWNVHRWLHKSARLWQFHKLHHSVEEMGFAAHVRYHWMENVVYWSVRVLPLTLLGYDLVDLFALHVLNVASGHFNHTNITVSPKVTGGILGFLIGAGLSVLYANGWLEWTVVTGLGGAVGFLVLGPYMRFIFNSPEMHIWHHAEDIPKSHPNGVNFGITLAIWDYLFKTAHVPSSGRDIKLGFAGISKYPRGFFKQIITGFQRLK